MRLHRLALGAVALLGLAACEVQTQTSSGADYLAARPDWARQAAASTGTANATVGIERAVYDAARAEPLLRFPARIGLARLQRGQITAIPEDEADAWAALVQKAGPGYGEFIVISPLVVGMGSVEDRGRSSLDRLRIGAARQHVDAMLVYDVRGSASDRSTPLSVLDVTIIGAFVLPTRLVAGQAEASAMLIDVRNGYPYGTISARGEARGISTNAGSWSRSQDRRQEAETEAVKKLTEQAATMMERLRLELAGRAAAEATANPPARGSANRAR